MSRVLLAVLLLLGMPLAASAVNASISTSQMDNLAHFTLGDVRMIIPNATSFQIRIDDDGSTEVWINSATTQWNYRKEGKNQTLSVINLTEERELDRQSEEIDQLWTAAEEKFIAATADLGR